MKKIEMGKKYRTRNGREVRLLCLDRKGSYPVVGLVGESEELFAWNSTGRYSLDGDDEYDLIEVSPYADIPIDTPGWARGAFDAGWRRRHFAGLSDDARPMTWDDGTTSHTSGGVAETWDEFTTVKPEGVE